MRGIRTEQNCRTGSRVIRTRLAIAIFQVEPWKQIAQEAVLITTST